MPPEVRRPLRRPPWWPADEPWPPSGRRFNPGPRFVWRVGCALLAMAGVAALALGALVWLLTGARITGHPFPLLLVIILAAIAISAAGSGRAVRRLTRPLGALVQAAGRVEAGDYRVHVPEEGQRELRSVARAFNAMTARLRENDERRRTLLADVTHELRTPLAIIRGQAEAIADGVYPGDEEHLAPIIESARTLELLTEDLRTLALSEAGSLTLAREHVDLAALAWDAVAAFRGQAEAAGVHLVAETAADVPPADVDPARIRSVVGNLVSNALRHTPSGRDVRVGVTARGDRIELTVADTGRGIPPDLLPRVFERFVKGSGSPGSGLGLAIARDVVTAHGGTIAIESQPGSGTMVRLELPAARR